MYIYTYIQSEKDRVLDIFRSVIVTTIYYHPAHLLLLPIFLISHSGGGGGGGSLSSSSLLLIIVLAFVLGGICMAGAIYLYFLCDSRRRERADRYSEGTKSFSKVMGQLQ
jgi:hypothetical protein